MTLLTPELAGLLTILLLACAGAQAATDKAGAAAMPVLAAVADVHTEPVPADTAWWRGFGEEPLNRLVEASAKRSLLQQHGSTASLVSHYLMFRIQHSRLSIVKEAALALVEERRLITARAPVRELAPLLVALDQRAQLAERAGRAYAEDCAIAQQGLLDIAGNSDETRRALKDALAIEPLPLFQRSVPLRLPASVLSGRADVTQLARYPWARVQLPEMLSGWIEPNSSPAPLRLTPTQTERSASEVVRQATQDVSWSLNVLISEARQTQVQSQRLEAARLELEATQRRVQAGDTTPAAIARALQQLFVQADALAAAHGRLASAWIELHSNAPTALQVLSALSAS
jgi:hypothetical protein